MSRTHINLSAVSILLLSAAPFLPSLSSAQSTQTPTVDSDRGPTIPVTAEEHAWLEAHPVIRFAGETGWPPFEFVRDGEYSGLASDYLSVVGQRLGVKFQRVQGIDWSQALDRIKRRELDLLPCCGITAERRKFLQFSTPYLSFPLVIVARKDDDSIRSLGDLHDRRIAVPRNYYTHEVLSRDHPAINLVLTDTEEQAIRSVAVGSADAFVGNLAVFGYFAGTQGFANLEVVGPTSYDNAEMAFAVRHDWPILAGLIQKSLDSVTPEEREAIYNKWISVRFEYGLRPTDILRYVVFTVAVAAAVVMVIALWNASLQKQIRERKEAEEVTRRYQFIVDAVKDRMSLINREYRYEAVNRAWCDSTGWVQADAIGKRVADVYGDNFFENDIKPHLLQVFEGGSLSYQTWLDAKESGPRFCDISLFPFGNAEGVVSHAVIVTRDITDQHRTQEALREREQRLKFALGSAKAGVYLWNIKTGEVQWDDRCLEIFGLSRDEFSGSYEDWIERHAPEERKQAEAGLIEAMRTRSEWKRQTRLTRPNGEIAHIQGFGYFICNESGEPESLVGLVFDITEQVEAQEALARARDEADAANRTKSDFLATMSHEIRTPMNAIIGLSHLALKTNLDRRQRDYLKKIQSASVTLLGIINDILDFSKIEAGKLSVESIPFDLDSVFENLANMTGTRAQDKEELEVMFRVPSDIPRHLVGDPLRLGQVLINLCSNAIKFTQKGYVTVSASARDAAVDRVTLEFSVADTGIGLSPQQRERLFQPFSQADSSTTRKYGGTGLGLTISKRLVELMGGEIGVESEEGKGSTFSFTVNLGLAPDRAPRLSRTRTRFKDLRVLVVDDNSASREILDDMLASFGYRVIQASSAEEAFQEVYASRARDPFDLILMDWKLTGLNGIDAAIRIKSDTTLAKKPAIMLVTAYGREHVIHEAERAGLDAVLLKPVSQSSLLDSIVSVFEGGDSDVTPEEADTAVNVSDHRAVRGARVLLTEDNEINQQVACELLAAAGVHVDIATNGAEAIAAVKLKAYDAVLMDCQMPEMDGYEATRRIRQIPGIERVPILAMTANAMAEDRKRCLDAGMDDHIAKPIDPDDLYTTLARWLKPRDQRHHPKAPSTSAVLDAESDTGMPEHIPGVDMQDGLTRLSHNGPLYLKLLRQFCREHLNISDKIAASLEANNRDEATRIAHTVKSVSGNLGALQMSATAAVLEAALRNGDETNLNALLSRFRVELNTLVDAIQSRLPAIETVDVKIAESDVSIDTDAVRRMALRMYDAFDTDLAQAMDDQVALSDLLEGTRFQRHVSAIRKAMDAFDFDAARRALDDLGRDLGFSALR